MIDSTTFPLSLAVEPCAQNFLEPSADWNRSRSGLEGVGPHSPEGRCQREELRHILLGSPGAIRQAIHQLHVLFYAESLLWSPVAAVTDSVVITLAQGAAISLLRRST